MPKSVRPYGLLFLILLALVPLKTCFDPDIGPRVYDGDYYYGVARLVSEGEGLTTNLSLYFQGFKSFPHRVTSSPVWPLTLGASGRLFGMRMSATQLPELLYFLDLFVLYFLAMALWRGVVGDADGWLFRKGWLPNFGHFAVLALATNVVFFRFSSVPNNDALGFLYLFLALAALHRAALRDSVRIALLAGALSGVALLTRAQSLGLVIAIPLVLGWVGLGRGRALRLSGAAVLGFVATMLPWLLYLASWKHPLTLSDMLGFETQRETEELAVFLQTLEGVTGWDYVWDRLGGLLVAFDWRQKFSYFFHFGALAYTVPLGLLAAGFALLRGRLRPGLPLDPSQALAVCMTMTGAAMLVPVHLHHASFAQEWLFGYRHGLPLLLLILPAAAYVDRHASSIFRVALLSMLVVTIPLNGLALNKLLHKNYAAGLTPVERELVEWLDAQSPMPAVVTTNSFALSAFSRSGFHWILCESDPLQTLRLLQHSGADYVIVYADERRCGYVFALRDRMRVARAFGQGEILVLELSDQVASDAAGAAIESESEPR
jgi:hypothetical protein